MFRPALVAGEWLASRSSLFILAEIAKRGEVTG
jgi:hypothetical protein